MGPIRGLRTNVPDAPPHRNGTLPAEIPVTWARPSTSVVLLSDATDPGRARSGIPPASNSEGSGRRHARICRPRRQLPLCVSGLPRRVRATFASRFRPHRGFWMSGCSSSVVPSVLRLSSGPYLHLAGGVPGQRLAVINRVGARPCGLTVIPHANPPRPSSAPGDRRRLILATCLLDEMVLLAAAVPIAVELATVLIAHQADQAPGRRTARRPAGDDHSPTRLKVAAAALLLARARC